ncbi:TPR-like protein [Clavulina sp. PMI_390]|nr:TPR-like protein [Clavulina sp. PMI_390]
MRPPPGVNPMSNLFSDPQLFSKLAANPKTAPWLADQSFVGKLKFAQSNPAMSQNILDDPRMITVLGVLMGVDMSGFAGDSPDVSFGGPGSPSSPGSRPPPTASSSKATPPSPAPAASPAPDVKMAEPEEPEELDEEAQAKQDALKEKELGNAAYKKRDFVQAEAHFTKAWDLWPKDMTFLTNLAAVYFESGDYAKTIQTCEKAIDEGRGIRADYKLIAKALGRIGSAYAKLDDLDNAIKFFNKSLTEHRTPDILNKLRDAEKEKKERDVKAYFNPELSAASREEGNKLFKAGKFADSVKEYTEAIARDPSDARGYNNRAAAYQKLAALPEALKDADKAIEVDPKFGKSNCQPRGVFFCANTFIQSRLTSVGAWFSLACGSTPRRWRPHKRQATLMRRRSTPRRSKAR